MTTKNDEPEEGAETRLKLVSLQLDELCAILPRPAREVSLRQIDAILRRRAAERSR